MSLMLGCGVAPVWAQDGATDTATVETPAPGKARVIFYRPGGFYYGLIGCPVFERGPDGARRIGGLAGGGYQIVDFEPGPHLFSASGKLKKPVEIALEAGRSHYIQCRVSGAPIGKPHLLASHRNEYNRYRDALSPVD